MWRLFFTLIFINSNLFAQNQVVALQNCSVVVKFDLITDEYINNTDPRIKSIIYSSQTLDNSKIIINYVNPNALSLARKLADIFSAQHLAVITPKLILPSSPHDNKYVQVTICY
jgi:hypothetical protein